VGYCTTCAVYSHVYSLVKPASAFDTSTCPSLSDVEQWITTGCAVINTYLAGKGYGVPTSGTALHEMLGQANALWAAALAEDSRVSARISADERTRGDRFYRQYEKLMAMVDRMDLSRAGLSQTSVAYAGGISKADVSSVESNSDRVKPRFKRGQFANPEAGRSDDYSSGS
jgi:hypothetical protein